MKARTWKFAAAATVAALAITACKNTQDSAPASAGEMTAGTPAASSGTGTTAGTGSPAGTSDIPALVNVNLQNVLNDLSVAIKVDRANIPVNAQVPSTWRRTSAAFRSARLQRRSPAARQAAQRLLPARN